MTKRNSFALGFLLCVVALLWPASATWAQDPEEKNTQEPGAAAKNTPTPEKTGKEQNPAQKNKGESTLGENSMNFPAAQGPVELRPARGTKITLKLSDSSRVAYEAIGRQAKINVLFDPDYVPRNISLDLNGVSLEDALKVVAFQSRSFWRPVTADTIFVAADSPVKRREFEQQVIKTFYFPNVTSSSDLQDIVNGIRTLVEVARIQQMPAYQTIMVRATPEQMAVTERMVNDLNQAKQKTGGEYRLEFKVTEINDDKKSPPKTYTMLIEPHQTAKVRTGSKIPIQTSEKERSYVEVGKKIDCIVRSETEHTVSLHFTVESSEVAPEARPATEPAGTNPVIQQVSMEASVTLELGTPAVVGNFQDPVSKHSFQIEATAVRTKSKE
jgi:hypothetical protein